MRDAFIYAGLRTPFGRYAGGIAGVRPDNLAGQLIRKLVADDWCDHIDDVILGCSNQAGEDSRNVARNAILASGLPETISGMTVNRLCASGLAAVVDAMRAIKSEEASLIVAGGVESMSRAPFVLGKAEAAFARDPQIFDSTLGARFSNPKVLAKHGAHSMPETGDEVAKELKISRQEADEFAAASQAKYGKALATGFFAGEILPVQLPPRKKAAPHELIFSRDEHPRPETTAADLARLSSLFPGGVVTAGNASGLNDGAAMLLIGDKSAEKFLGTKPLARILGSAAVGCQPRTMGLGPVGAINKLLQRFNLDLRSIDVLEINEAFASQVLGCLKLLEIDFHDSRVNPNGGAIAIGHPLGASGARLALTTARQLQRQGGRYGIASLCVGMGQGTAVLLERV
jgi:acetyl-CoA C-acetyltransferase